MAIIVKYLQLPFAFDVLKMQQELEQLQANWNLHYNANDYEGDWSAISLRSVGGALNSILAEGGDEEGFADTALMGLCPYVKQVVDTFQCEKHTVRLMRMKPGAVIKEHTDRELNYENGMVRFHVPVTTNPDLDFFLDDERMVLKEGECWYMNFNLKHRLANRGTTDRTHLVLDCIVNDWVKDVFDENGTGVKKEFEVEDKRMSPAELQSMLESLRSMNTPIALELAAKLEAEHQLV